MTGSPPPPPPPPPPGARPRPPLPDGVPFADALPREDHAGFWRRVVASLIDGALYSAGSFFSPLGTVTPGNERAADVLSGALLLVAAWIYRAGMESSRHQATLGKIAMSICVTDLDGRRLTFGRATGRHFAAILSALTLGIGFLMAAWTRRKQALHDIVAGTLVVQRDALPPDRGPRPL